MIKQEYEKNLIQSIIASIERHGGKEFLSSIILTGSFGRGEPTFTLDHNGNLSLKSDVEIALIYPNPFQKNRIEKLIEAVSQEFNEELNLMAITEKRVLKAYNFNYSIMVPKYKTIFTFDLFNGSYKIWGTDYIGRYNVDISDVDVYEAKRLVANRIGELVYLSQTADEESKAYLYMQWKGKLMLAIVSAWLICEEQYVSSYRGQYEKIKESRNVIESELSFDFFEEYNKVFKFLRERGCPYEVPDRLLRSYVKKINQYFIAKSIKTPKVNSFSHLVKYYIKYIKAGTKYGLVNFEDKILQELIDGYCKNKSNLGNIADVWHRVLY